MCVCVCAHAVCVCECICVCVCVPACVSLHVCESVSLSACVLHRNYTSFSLDPTLKRSEMTEHLRRDDDNPSEDLRGSQPSAT